MQTQRTHLHSNLLVFATITISMASDLKQVKAEETTDSPITDPVPAAIDWINQQRLKVLPESGHGWASSVPRRLDVVHLRDSTLWFRCLQDQDQNAAFPQTLVTPAPEWHFSMLDAEALSLTLSKHEGFPAVVSLELRCWEDAIRYFPTGYDPVRGLSLEPKPKNVVKRTVMPLRLQCSEEIANQLVRTLDFLHKHFQKGHASPTTPTESSVTGLKISGLEPSWTTCRQEKLGFTTMAATSNEQNPMSSISALLTRHAGQKIQPQRPRTKSGNPGAESSLLVSENAP